MAIDMNQLIQMMQQGGQNPFATPQIAPSQGGGGQQQPQGGGGNPYLNFLQSPGGRSLIEGGMGAIGAIGQQRSNERMNAQQLALQQQQMAQQQGMANQQDRLARDTQYLQAAPTGWGQNYQQNTLLKNIMLQNLMNGGGNLTPTNEAVRAKLEAQAGSAFKPTIPEEWTKMNPFGVDQTMQSLAQRQGGLDMLSQGRGPGMDFAAMGYDPEKAGQLNQQTSDYRNFQAQQGNPLNEAINMNRQGTNQQQQIPDGYEIDKKTGELKKKGSIWGKIGKGLAIGGAGLATALSGGAASPLLMAAIGSGIGAASGALQGGGVKGALLGAAGGAIPGFAGPMTAGMSGVGKTLINGAINQGANGLKNAAAQAGAMRQIGPATSPSGWTGANPAPNPYQQPLNPYIRRTQ